MKLSKLLSSRETSGRNAARFSFSGFALTQSFNDESLLASLSDAARSCRLANVFLSCFHNLCVSSEMFGTLKFLSKPANGCVWSWWKSLSTSLRSDCRSARITKPLRASIDYCTFAEIMYKNVTKKCMKEK
jgi:hypothetical protein